MVKNKLFNRWYFWNWRQLHAQLACEHWVLKYGFCKKLLRYKWTFDHWSGQKVRKKCQRFICAEVTSYKIHSLDGPPWSKMVGFCDLLRMHQFQKFHLLRGRVKTFIIRMPQNLKKSIICFDKKLFLLSSVKTGGRILWPFQKS